LVSKLNIDPMNVKMGEETMVGSPCYETFTLNKGENGGVQSRKDCCK
jgi:hypothetical protein